MRTIAERTPEFRGVIEGFYGVYYTFPERDDLIRFIGKLGYNYYLYGPKNDRQHRMRWREPYPESVMEQFARTARTAEESGVTFCYALGSGVTMAYSSPDDFACLTKKCRAFHRLGVRAFSILLDDISPDFRHEEDRRRYATFAEAHADASNRLYAWLKELDAACALSMCPTDYHGSAPFGAYLHELGERLHPDIDIFYTGPDICSREIPAEQVRAFAAAARRRPILWDNYPVNDLDMKAELHLGPIRGRSAELAGEAKGFLVNPMIQAEASKIPLLTYADYLRDPSGYDPRRSWERAVREVAGPDGFEAVRLFAGHCLASCLGEPDAVELRELADAALASLRKGERANGNPALERLEAYTTELDEACYHIKNRLANLALRNNLLPWVELMEHGHWMTKRAILALAAKERGEADEGALRRARESLADIRSHPKRLGTLALLPFAEYALALAENR